MKETMIPFSSPMIIAIMNNKKTQTRRIINADLDNHPPFTIRENDYVWSARMSQQWTRGGRALKCPFGNIGDRLLVKEAIEGRNDTKLHDGEQMPITVYRADGAHIWTNTKRLPWRWKPKSLPSIYMPKELCRIKLDITNVRIERLHAITAKDILAEGVIERSHEVEGLGKCPISAIDSACYPDLRSLWAAAWVKINGEESWKSNPYIWVIEFKKAIAS